jgi:hypothetical protein
VALSTAAETELRNMLRAFRAAHSGMLAPTGEGKALEAWVLMKLAETVRRRMSRFWRVSLRQGDGTVLPTGSTFNFPSQRSRIQPSNVTAPGYVLIEHKVNTARRFELRGSIQWKGRSDAKHEIDVSLMPASIGEAIRNNGGGYPHGLPIVAVECKDKGGYGPLDETRQTLARMYDLVLVTQPIPGWSCRIFETNTHTQWGRKSSRYIAFFRKGTFGIVRAGYFQSGATTLAEHYSIGHFSNIYNVSTEINRLQDSFRDTLSRVGNF